MLQKQNIMITGGAGFIGSHLAETLLGTNNYVSIIDNFRESREEKKNILQNILESYQEGTDFNIIEGSLLNPEIFEKIDKNIDLIFHLAAIAGVRYSLLNPTEITENNICSTVNIFEYSRKCGIKKVVFASSSSVYGNPIYTPVDEDHPKNPISPYAVSKLACEYYCDYYFREYSIPSTWLRFYTVYGPWGRKDMAIRKFIERVLKGEEIVIYGDGEQLRDFTYISDIVDGLILAAENEKADGEAFNLGCGNPISVNELVNKIYKITDRPKNVKYIDAKKGDVRVTHSDITKAQVKLGFSPKVNIDQGIKNTYEWEKDYLNM
jgi:UDP-glucose 4-epimerase